MRDIINYFKDWRIWLLALVIFFIVEFPICSWGKEITLIKPTKITEISVDIEKTRITLLFTITF